MTPEHSNRKPAGDAAGRTTCEAVRLLIPWIAANPDAAALTEREEVEAHVAACEECAEQLAFAMRLAEEPAPADWHPEAASLTDYADAPHRLGAAARARLEAHLGTCPACAESVAALRAIAPPQTGEHPGLLARWWQILAGGVLRPIPAAAYLAAAVAAGALLITTHRSGDGPPGPGQAGDAPAWLGSPHILVDGSGIDRSASGEAVATDPTGAGVTVRAGARQLLLVEFTNLMAPPSPEALYRVRVQPAETDEVVWTSPVPGRAFAENYTLSLMLEPGTLSPGRYRIQVTSPEEEVVFTSGFSAE